MHLNRSELRHKRLQRTKCRDQRWLLPESGATAGVQTSDPLRRRLLAPAARKRDRTFPENQVLQTWPRLGSARRKYAHGGPGSESAINFDEESCLENHRRTQNRLPGSIRAVLRRTPVPLALPWPCQRRNSESETCSSSGTDSEHRREKDRR